MKLDSKTKLTLSIGSIVAIVTAFWQSHGWLAHHISEFVLTRAEAQQIQTDVGTIKGQVADVKKQISEVSADLLAKEIDAVSAALCMEQYDPRLLDYRNLLQNRYHDVKGEYRQSPACEILLKLKH